MLVPRSAKMEIDVTSHIADNAQMSLAPEIVTRRTTVKARKGETVATIAKRYALNAASVAEWNSVSATSAFKLGHQVVVFLPVKSQSGKPSTGKSKSSGKSTGRKAVVKTKRR